MDDVLTKEEILAYLHEREEYLRQERHIKKIALIGSFARNEQRAQSDIDILVDIEKGTPGIFELKQALRTELMERFGRNVDIASERYLKPYYRNSILKEAVYAYQ